MATLFFGKISAQLLLLQDQGVVSYAVMLLLAVETVEKQERSWPYLLLASLLLRCFLRCRRRLRIFLLGCALFH